MTRNLHFSIRVLVLFLVLGTWFAWVGVVEAASLRVTPGTGVYQAGATFTARVQVVTAGNPVNAAEGVLSFNPNELAVVSVNRSSSIFNLWVAEPTFSNTAGTISFSGGVPAGYTGSIGDVLSITFRAKNAGSPRVSFSSGSVLANDGRGTNVLTAMNGGTYTIQAASSAPEPERIVEYVPPANTPDRPTVTSKTHADPADWHATNTAELAWFVPSDVTAVRTLLSSAPTAIPSKVYETPISSLTLTDLPEGESYFHIQFKNADGWGRVRSYRLAVDTEAPTNVTAQLASTSDIAAPEQMIEVIHAADTSGIATYRVKIDDAEPYDVVADSSLISLPVLEPGYHSVILEVIDAAGNSTITTFAFTIEAFEKPVFTEIPTEMSGDVIPVIIGSTRPNALVTVEFTRLGSEPNYSEVSADESGTFTFIPEGVLYTGVYEITARATDQYGAQSEVSDVRRIAVQQPGYVRIGNQVVDALSIIVPLFLMVLTLLFGVWYALYLFRRFRGALRVESTEALDILHREFGALQSELREQESGLQNSRKTKKLTKAEAAMIESFDRSLQKSQRAVEKEIEDVTKLVTPNT